jgi:hypothetical protein
MAVEGEDRRPQALLAAHRDGSPNDVLVTNMDAIEGPDGKRTLPRGYGS